MDEPSDGPVPVGPGEVERVVEILTGAFYADPAWAWAFPDPGLRRQQQGRLWRLFVQGAVRFPHVYLNSDATATAVWIPPGEDELSADQEARLHPLIEELLGDDAPRVLDTFDAFEAARPPQPAHFYLTLLGTDPARLGRGAGLGLLADTLRIVDRAGCPAYLEASNPGNVALYRRFGFEPHGSFRLPHGGPGITTMWRAPAS